MSRLSHQFGLHLSGFTSLTKRAHSRESSLRRPREAAETGALHGSEKPRNPASRCVTQIWTDNSAHSVKGFHRSVPCNAQGYGINTRDQALSARYRHGPSWGSTERRPTQNEKSCVICVTVLLKPFEDATLIDDAKRTRSRRFASCCVIRLLLATFLFSVSSVISVAISFKGNLPQRSRSSQRRKFVVCEIDCNLRIFFVTCPRSPRGPEKPRNAASLCVTRIWTDNSVRSLKGSHMPARCNAPGYGINIGDQALSGRHRLNRHPTSPPRERRKNCDAPTDLTGDAKREILRHLRHPSS